MPDRRAPGLFAVAVLAAGLTGCALPIQDEMDGMSGIARYATRYDHAVGARDNLLDRSLADCGEKTLKAETVCVRQGIDGAHPSLKALMALVPGCRPGRICHYDQTTRDRLGFVEANATTYVKRWRIDLDLRDAAPDVAHVPVTVIDRDDFDTAPVAAKSG